MNIPHEAIVAVVVVGRRIGLPYVCVIHLAAVWHSYIEFSRTTYFVLAYRDVRSLELEVRKN